MRRKNLNQRQTLLNCAHRIECAEGVDAISIRRLASEANIAVGTVYNYFESKQEVLLSLTEFYWTGVLANMHSVVTAERFSDQAAQILEYLRSEMKDCAEILMRALREHAEPGRVRMAAMQRNLDADLTERLRKDTAIRPDAWRGSITMESFARFVRVHIVALLQDEACDPAAFLEIINRMLY